jgi:hypothetical protein
MRRGMLAMVRTPGYSKEILQPELPTLPPDDPLHWWVEAAELFMKIREQHGISLAKEIFTALGAPSLPADQKDSLRFINKQRREYRENEAVRFFFMCRRDGLNLEQIARKFAAQNKTTAAENRLGPRGSTDPTAIRVWLTRVLKKQGIEATKPRARKPR